VWSELDQALKASWSTADLVATYAAREGLTPAESKLLSEYVPATSRVLDIGIGAGRTTGPLTDHVSSYVGIDYSPPMIAAARARHPGVDLRLADASDLSAWATHSFDVLFFSYNGIDCLHPDAKRWRFLEEAWRVLRRDGLLIFSTHNPRYLLDVSALDPRTSTRGRLGIALRSLTANAPRLLTRAFWTGHGYQDDRTNRGFVLHAGSPGAVRDELATHGFTLVDHVPSTYPHRRLPGTAPWNYFVARSTDVLPPRAAGTPHSASS
jgi:SAM-dependent methyltransferase